MFVDAVHLARIVACPTHVVVARILPSPMAGGPGIRPSLHSLVGGSGTARLAVLGRDPLVARSDPTRDRLGSKLGLVTDVRAGIRLPRRRVM
jgi:hypothetical protein